MGLLAPTEGQDIVADYERTSLTLRRHPLALLRRRFDRMRLLPASKVNSARHRQPVRTTGIVTCRQRPSTASGVTFVTIEDETGVLNVVVWRTTAEKYRQALLESTLLTVYGHVERVETSETPVVHLIASRLADDSRLFGGLKRSRMTFTKNKLALPTSGGLAAAQRALERTPSFMIRLTEAYTAPKPPPTPSEIFQRQFDDFNNSQQISITCVPFSTPREDC